MDEVRTKCKLPPMPSEDDPWRVFFEHLAELFEGVPESPQKAE